VVGGILGVVERLAEHELEELEPVDKNMEFSAGTRGTGSPDTT
jgi:hypothetical protein